MRNAEKQNMCEDGAGSSNWLKYMDIDSDHKNPQLCSLYAPEIYMNLSVAEVSVIDIFLFLQ